MIDSQIGAQFYFFGEPVLVTFIREYEEPCKTLWFLSQCNAMQCLFHQKRIHVSPIKSYFLRCDHPSHNLKQHSELEITLRKSISGFVIYIS